MKRLLPTILLYGARLILSGLLCGILFLFTAASKTKKITADIWEQLGLTQPEANKNINNSLSYGTLYYDGAKNAKNILVNDRAAIVNELVAYARKYAASEEFKREYLAYRNRLKPEAPALLPGTVESIKEEERQRLQKMLKQAEENLNSPNPKIKNGAPYQVENLKKQLSALDDPGNRMIKAKMDNINRSNEYATKLSNQKLEKWETAYPADPQLMIKKRLQEILDITADVDYAAGLKEMNGKKYFVDLLYEKKPPEWKLAFRAGKAATDAVRAAAEQWLLQLK